MFLKDHFMVFSDLENYIQQKWDPQCSENVEIEYIPNKCPLTYNPRIHKDKFHEYSMGCLKFKNEQYLKFEQCLQDNINNSFQVFLSQDYTTICYKVQPLETNKLMIEFRDLSSKCIIENKCEQIKDELQEGFRNSDLILNKGFCSENCKICKDFLQCQECENGYELIYLYCKPIKCQVPKVLVEGLCKCSSGYAENDNGSCIKCQVSNCKTCEAKEPQKCSSCLDNYLFKEGTCVSQCGLKYYEEKGKCNLCSDRCIECTNRFNCIHCQQDHIPQDGKCVLHCKNGEYGQNGKCKACTPHCKYCLGKFDMCDECNEGYLLINDSKTCDTKCPANYYQDNLTCKKCHRNCSECTGPTARECVQCSNTVNICELDNEYEKDPTHLRQNKPIKPKYCKDSPLTNCNICNDLGICVKCEGDYTFDIDLFQCSKCNDDNCQSCSFEFDQTCYKCKESFNLLNNKCILKCPEEYTSIDRQCILCSNQQECQPGDSSTKYYYIGGGVMMVLLPVGGYFIYKIRQRNRRIFAPERDDQIHELSENQENDNPQGEA